MARDKSKKAGEFQLDLLGLETVKVTTRKRDTTKPKPMVKASTGSAKPVSQMSPAQMAKLRQVAAKARAKAVKPDARFSRLSRDQRKILMALLTEATLTTTEVAVLITGAEEFHSMPAPDRKILRNTVRKSMAKLEDRGLVVSEDVPNKSQRQNWSTGEVEWGVFGQTKSYRLASGVRNDCKAQLRR